MKTTTKILASSAALALALTLGGCTAADAPTTDPSATSSGEPGKQVGKPVPGESKTPDQDVVELITGLSDSYAGADILTAFNDISAQGKFTDVQIAISGVDEFQDVNALAEQGYVVESVMGSMSLLVIVATVAQ